MSCGNARRPTNGRPLSAPVADGMAFAFGPFPLSWEALRNGPEQSRARGFCAAERTLDGEDRSGTWSRRERGRGFQGIGVKLRLAAVLGQSGRAGGFRGCPPGGGPGQRPAHLTARAVCARHQELNSPLRHILHSQTLSPAAAPALPPSPHATAPPWPGASCVPPRYRSSARRVCPVA